MRFTQDTNVPRVLQRRVPSISSTKSAFLHLCVMRLYLKRTKTTIHIPSTAICYPKSSLPPLQQLHPTRWSHSIRLIHLQTPFRIRPTWPGTCLITRTNWRSQTRETHLVHQYAIPHSNLSNSTRPSTTLKRHLSSSSPYSTTYHRISYQTTTNQTRLLWRTRYINTTDPVLSLHPRRTVQCIKNPTLFSTASMPLSGVPQCHKRSPSGTQARQSPWRVLLKRQRNDFDGGSNASNCSSSRKKTLSKTLNKTLFLIYHHYIHLIDTQPLPKIDNNRHIIDTLSTHHLVLIGDTWYQNSIRYLIKWFMMWSHRKM